MFQIQLKFQQWGWRQWYGEIFHSGGRLQPSHDPVNQPARDGGEPLHDDQGGPRWPPPDGGDEEGRQVLGEAKVGILVIVAASDDLDWPSVFFQEK